MIGALLQNESLAHSILEAAPDAMILMDERDLIIMVNARATDLFGYSREEMLYQPVEMLMPENWHEQNASQRSLFHLSPRRRAMGSGLDLYARRKDGSELPADMKLSPVEIDGGNAVIAAIRDMLDIIEAGANRGADLVKQSLAFAHGRDGQRGLKQLRHLLKDMGRLMRDTFPKCIESRIECPQDLWPVEGDSTQLPQVSLNLCVNARDAMPQGGKLTVSAANVSLTDADTAAHPGVDAGSFVMVKVSDTGAGMPQELAARVFEPFFTTKEPGGGTGLGLPTVLNIVRGHRGAINVHSEPGKRAEFKVYLPAQPGAVLTEASPELSRSVEGHGEQVLVVDDEPSVVQLVCRTLKEHGYRPLSAFDGTEALTIFLQHHDSIKAVFTDLMMPFLSGFALIRALRRIDASVPIIAVTGSPLSELKTDRQTELAELGVGQLLLKPFETEELLRMLRDAMDAAPGSGTSTEAGGN